MIKTNNTPVEAEKVDIATSNIIQQTVAQTLVNNADSADYGRCRCQAPAIGPHGYCADHL